MTKAPFFLVGTLFLVSCTGSMPVQEGDVSGASSSTPVQTSETADDHGQMYPVEIPTIGLRFMYWKEAFAVENMVSDERFSFDLTSSRDGTSDDSVGWVSDFPYDRPSDGLGDWTVPSSIRASLIQGTDEHSCNLLVAENVYVPVNMGRPNLCKALVDAHGNPVIVAIGPEHPFESLDAPTSMIMHFGEKRVTIIYGLAEFPEMRAAIDAMVADYMEENPETYFPNPSYEVLAEKVSAFVDEQFEHPSIEMQNALGTLTSVGQQMEVK